MLGWIAGAAALVAIVVTGVNLDFIQKTDTFVGNLHQNLAATFHSMQTATSSLALSSPAFEATASIPVEYTCDLPAQAGATPKNPPLSIRGVPSEAKSLALLMDDPDVPKALRPDGVFDHWVLFNVPPTVTDIAEGETVGVAGANGAGEAAYAGPCPPRQYEPSEHRYFFKLYALDAMLDLPAGTTKAQVEEAMKGHVLQEAELMGKYKRE